MTDIVSIVKSNNSTVATINTNNKPPKSSDKYIKKVDFQRFKFDTPTLNFRVVHNMNTTQFIETIKDSNGNRMYARLEIEGPNAFNIHLTEAMAGTVDVLFGIEYTP
jgi:hypothetical protein